MKVAITGADGFLGWHARCALRARATHEAIPIARSGFASDDLLDDALRGAQAVLHLAGVNRSPDADAPRSENVQIAHRLTASLNRLEITPAIIYANSIQAGNDTPFGAGKAEAAEELARWGRRIGAPVADVLLPNLFGEHGRPHYNSVVATFCHQLANGDQPDVIDDREVPLLHVQDAVDVLLDLIDHPSAQAVTLAGRPTSVSEVLRTLEGFRDVYRGGDIPDIGDPFSRALFNTYRSYCFPELFPIHPPVRSDPRGDLFEAVRDHGGQAHVFVSSTRPGSTRGQHFHLRKVERFLVLNGTGQITLRRLFDDSIVRFDVSGDRPAIVDMPTMWVHAITNTGDRDLTTLFWADEILDPDRPDTYPERVECEGVG